MRFISAVFDVSAKAAAALSVSCGIVVAASVAPAPALADATSDALLSALNDSGVSYADPATAVTMAQSVCPLLVKPGGDFAAVASQVGGTNGISPGMANLFTSIAISTYCPGMIASIANGHWLGQATQMNLPGLTGLAGFPGL